MSIDRKQLPGKADVLQQIVLHLIAQLDAEQARRIKTEHLLQQLLQAKNGRRSEQLSDDQLALFAAERNPPVEGRRQVKLAEDGGRIPWAKS